MKSSSTPLATYRLQSNAGFTFRDAIGILNYLRDLGISHVYASPIFMSRRGSKHGYDVTDPLRINPELGGEDGFTAFQEAAKERGLGLLLDIVPNHMAANSENRWWMDVLEYGPDSPFASYFDINWRARSQSLDNKILLPFLDRPFADVLNSGDLEITYEEGKFVVRYGAQLFPVAPQSYAQILNYRDADNGGAVHDDSTAVHPDSTAANEWQGIVAAAESIAADKNAGTQAATERRTKFEALHDRLRKLLAASAEMQAMVERILQRINGHPGDARSLQPLERILSSQHYRLAFWQTASDAINYRRFFSITDLVGVRVEDPSVFQATHQTLTHLGLNSCGVGFRIDHIDGLRDPQGYLNRLRELLQKKDSDCTNYVVVEKILERNESLPDDWPIQGTTGYDYLNFANRLMVDADRAAEMLDIYERWTSSRANFDDIVYEKKKLVMRTLLGVEMRSLGLDLADHAAEDRYARELDPLALTQTLVEVTASLPVYRTYIQSLEVPEEARRVLTAAIRAARARNPGLPQACFAFVSDVLLVTPREHVRPDQREARLAFATRWQQFTGSIMAKGLEDTALYVYYPLVALNEVGGDPRIQEAHPLAFHEFIAKRQAKWPHSMNATTTHDTKRSEDARARIAVLSEMPREWEGGLQEWSGMNGKYASRQGSETIPDRNEEYLFYQTLVGAWPLVGDDWDSFGSRMQEYVIKAVREAKVHTRWTRQNAPHEAALREFAGNVLNRTGNSDFIASFERFQATTALYGMLNGLAQTVLKIACPGVADCYQGADFWDLRLVDPDNRSAVDFAKRAAALNELQARANGNSSRNVCELLRNWRDARVKLLVLASALHARQENPELFVRGDYQPLETSGNHHVRVVAFARTHGANWAIAAVPRCLASLRAPVISERHQFWEGTFLLLPEDAPAKWVNIFAGKDGAVISRAQGRMSLGDVFADFPVALLLPAGEHK